MRIHKGLLIAICLCVLGGIASGATDCTQAGITSSNMATNHMFLIADDIVLDFAKPVGDCGPNRHECSDSKGTWCCMNGDDCDPNTNGGCIKHQPTGPQPKCKVDTKLRAFQPE